MVGLGVLNRAFFRYPPKNGILESLYLQNSKVLDLIT